MENPFYAVLILGLVIFSETILRQQLLSNFESSGAGDLLMLLNVSSDEKILPTTYGELRPPLGKHRLKVGLSDRDCFLLLLFWCQHLSNYFNLKLIMLP